MKNFKSSNELLCTKNDQLKKSVIKARNIIRKKFQDLHNQKLSTKEYVSETYKPIIEPLEKLVKNGNLKNEAQSIIKHEPTKLKNEKETRFFPESVFKTALPSHRKNQFTTPSTNEMSSSMVHDVSGISTMYEDDANGRVNQMKSDLKQDKDYGFHYVNGELKLGKEKVHVKSGEDGENTYVIKNKRFAVTPGLTSLLMNRNPSHFTEDELEEYKDMLKLTSAHKKNFDKKGSIKRSPSHPKFKLIGQLFPPGKTRGGSLKKLQTNYKRVNQHEDSSFDYVYWDNPNELVDRLRLLKASQAAGHTGHDNEIISIIEELREAKIIK